MTFNLASSGSERPSHVDFGEIIMDEVASGNSIVYVPLKEDTILWSFDAQAYRFGSSDEEAYLFENEVPCVIDSTSSLIKVPPSVSDFLFE